MILALGLALVLAGPWNRAFRMTSPAVVPKAAGPEEVETGSRLSAEDKLFKELQAGSLDASKEMALAAETFYPAEGYREAGFREASR